MSDAAQPALVNRTVFSRARGSLSSTPTPGVVPATVGASSPTSASAQQIALDLLDQVLVEAEAQTPTPVVEPVAEQPAEPSALAQALPGVVAQATQTLNPSQAVSTTAKENFAMAPVATSEIPGVQQVEQEVSAEISPEVEAYLQQVEQHQDQHPHEIVIADGSVPQMRPYQPPTPVVVLPITPEVEKVGEKKNPSFSVKWLVEWSRRVMKMFTGKVIYREA